MKTVKNKSKLKSCKDFCKRDHVVEMNRVVKQMSEQYKIPYAPPTKEADEYAYQTCIKTYCNENCDGYVFPDDKQRKTFYGNITDGFQAAYTPEKRKKLREKGALSGCVDSPDYDVFHK